MIIKAGQILELEIIDLAFGGKGIAKAEDFTIFVDGALPGQKVEAKINLKKRRYANAKTLKVIQKSPQEIDLEYQNIPGAPWLNLPIEIQMEHKKNQVTALFQKISHIDINPFLDEYISSPETWFYRNKMDYSFGPTTEHPPVFTEKKEGNEAKWSHSGFGLGSKKRGQYWLVENLEKPSGIFDADFESLIPDLKNFCESLIPSAYNSRKNEGFWRQLVVRKSFHEDKFLINVITNINDDSSFDFKKITNFFADKLGEKVKGIYWTQSDDVGNANDKYQSRELLYGSEKIIEKINDLDFEISIDSFFQTNIFAAEKLYEKVASYVSDSDEILELFAGTGTISQILSRQNPKAKITSVEIVDSAVKDARKNAKQNQIQHINFVCADVFKFLKNYDSKPPTVVLDPPRAGIAPKALAKIIEFEPQEIIYVSCNPSTLARDAQTLIESEKYKIEKISLVDQFPHTAHVECIMKFAKK